MTPYVGPRTAKSRILVGAIQNGEVAASRREPEPMSPECGIGAEPVRQIGPPQMAAKGQSEPRPRRLREGDRRGLERDRLGRAALRGSVEIQVFLFNGGVGFAPQGRGLEVVAGFSGEAKG